MSLRLKTIIGIAVIEAVLLTLLILTVMGHMHDTAEQALQKRALTTARLFASTAKDPVLSYDLASLDTFSAELLSNPDIAYVRIREADGALLSASGPQELIDLPFVQDTDLVSVDDGVFDTSAPIAESDIEYGRVEIGIDTSVINASIAETRQLTLVIAAVEMLLVALFSWLLGRYLTGQMLTLRTAAKTISKGRYPKEIQVKSKDEVGEVAVAFNHMAATLRKTAETRDSYEAQLMEFNRTLERRVEKRTEKINAQMLELQVANKTIADTQAKLLQSEKLASIGQLSAGIAHEINNPIAFVHSNVSTLEEYIAIYQKLISLYQQTSADNNTDIDEITQKIRKFEEEEDIGFINEDISSLISDTLDGAVRIKDIVHGLKEFSHNNDNSKSACDIIQCLESTLKIAQNEMKNKCEVIKEFQPIPMIIGDKGQLNQVLLNIIVNAAQAIENEGVITISTSVRDSMVEIAIADNGSGIDTNIIDRLFDPFFTTKPAGQGTGLGLSISYGIVKDHGGDIKVESTSGEGTIFRIYLPVVAGVENTLAA